MKPEVVISKPRQEVTPPELNRMDSKLTNRIFYKLRKVTRPSHVSIKPREVERPLGLRATRAELLREALKATGRKRRAASEEVRTKDEIFEEARVKDEIFRRYLQQSDISVTLPGLGQQQARFLELHPPESVRTPETDAQPPIFIVPVISSDIEPQSEVARELAYRGRTVVIAGYPEASLGRVTKAFADKAVTSDDFSPHTEYFKTILKHWMQERGTDTVELWSYSTGAPIAAEMLCDSEIQEKVSRAVFMAPAATANQTRKSMNWGILKEFKKILPSPSSILIWGRKSSHPLEEEEQAQEKKRIFNRLQEKIINYSPAWGTARVREGGSMVMLFGDRDDVTKTASNAKRIHQGNPRIQICEFPKARHWEPLIKPKPFIDAALAA